MTHLDEIEAVAHQQAEENAVLQAVVGDGVVNAILEVARLQDQELLRGMIMQVAETSFVSGFCCGHVNGMRDTLDQVKGITNNV